MGRSPLRCIASVLGAPRSGEILDLEPIPGGRFGRPEAPPLLWLRVQEALNSLDPIDREMLALRHSEQLGRAEAAQVLGITREAGRSDNFGP